MKLAVSSFNKDESGQILAAKLSSKVHREVLKDTLLHLPDTVSLNLADPGKLSDPKMPQPHHTLEK